MLPTFIVIGAMKCATTSLHYYLDLHPQVFMSQRKELDFFVSEKQWDKGLAWYESNFRDDFAINGESSTAYTKYPLIKDIPKRMHSVIPRAKLIYVVRDPVERIVSHYVHEYAQGRESRPIADALNPLENNQYVDLSRYHFQIRQYLDFYPLDRILVVMAEELRDNRLLTLRRIFRFLDVDDEFYSDQFCTMLNISADKRRKNKLGHFLSKLSVQHYKLHVTPPASSRKFVRFVSGSKFERPVLDRRLKKELVEALQSDTSSLRTLTGLNFKEWCV
jgi:hypothetical protein